MRLHFVVGVAMGPALLAGTGPLRRVAEDAKRLKIGSEPSSLER
jgi:hypothetical protein